MNIELEIKISQPTREGLRTALERIVASIRTNDFADYQYAGGGGGSGGSGGQSCGESVRIKWPPEPPLTETEIRRLRGLLK